MESQGEEIVELKRADKVREGHITALQIEMKSKFEAQVGWGGQERIRKGRGRARTSPANRTGEGFRVRIESLYKTSARRARR